MRIVRNVDASNPQRPTRSQPMRIMPNADPKFVRRSISLRF
jgi:hypothetical protein